MKLILLVAIVAMSVALSGLAGAQEVVPNVPWGSAVLRQPSEWYGSEAARAIAESVVQYQSPQGGWPKSTDLATPPRSPEGIPPPGRGRANSLDNNAIALPIPFLARVAEATGEQRYRKAVLRSIDYLIEAQYPNGGWPQFYPLRKGYYSHITYNDNAMVSALTILRDASTRRPPYSYIEEEQGSRAAAAVGRGVECILRTQVRQRGRLTAWCAQHDEQTLEPAWARAYEPPSLSGAESVGIVRFLMDIEDPSPAVIAAVEGAVAWLQEVAIRDVRVEEFTNSDVRRDRRVVAAPDAGTLWARFYELGTNRPIFLGRDSEFRYDFAEIEHERRIGYSYFGNWAASLLDRDYPRWRDRVAPPQEE